ncbi:extracellular serine-threonine rich protein [Trichophyton verrucosum HKI 0517]|uniref:Extracellular serine-threonine rich protein n=1 Tax=Trichophyton verrucosum (strain HKI 0517) TaxID=663202 RepID=D4DAC3_TRIVH|nr:extracellular serine-threonine rich protein [Trichophyton verrucosum HKI 0517]EFE41204.1 extracellular serine-threonine rich protein [Trichophyton verrucosum HKI 0517]
MKVTLVVAALAAAVSAVTPPNYSLPPSGNPIGTPGLHEKVPVDKPYAITWQATTESHVSIMLLHGCPKNCNPVQTLAENIPNTGSLSWTPSSDLTGDDSYGLVIVVEGTGQYQYSTNFGIENHSPKPQPPKSTTPAEKPTWTPQPSKPVTHIVEASSSTPVPSGGVITLTTSICPPSATTSTVPGVPQPTGSAPVPGTPHPTGGNPGPAPAPSGSGAPVPPPASTNTPPPFNNGAGRVGAGFGAALLVVAAAFAM